MAEEEGPFRAFGTAGVRGSSSFVTRASIDSHRPTHTLYRVLTAFLNTPTMITLMVQRDQGFTGSDISIHGPHRKWKWLGKISTWMDWTQGCIAVASNSVIEEIADWVKLKKPNKIFIE